MRIFEVIHVHDVADDDIPDIKSLGYFSKYENACAVINHRKTVVGFEDYPNGFIIIPHDIDEEVKNIYVLWLAVHDEEYQYDFERTIGLYTSMEAAEKAKQEFCKFNASHILKCKLVVEVNIDEATIDADNSWLFGFSTD